MNDAASEIERDGGAARLNPALRPSNILGLQAAFVLGSALVYVWSHRFLPLQDYPDWLTQGKLYADMLRDGLASEYVFKGVPVPNAMATVSIGTLSLWFEPETAGKLVLSAYLIGYVGALYYLLSASGQAIRPTIFAACLVFVLNYTFFHGELNYALSLIALFTAQAMVLRASEELTWRVIAGVAVGSLVIYACHGAAFGAWLMFLTAYAWVARSRSTSVWILLALLPSLVLAAIYALSMTAQPHLVLPGWSPIVIVTAMGDKLWLITKSISPFQAFYPYLDPPEAWWLLVGNFAAIALLLWVLVRWLREKERAQSTSERAIGVCLAFYAIAIVLAPNNIAGLLKPAERFVMPAFQLIALRMAASPRTLLSGGAALKLSWLALAAQAIYLHVYVGHVSGQLAATHERLSEFVQASPISVLHESHFEFEGRPYPARPLLWRPLPLHYPLLRITYYASLEAGRRVPIFDTGLFRNASATYLQNSAEAAASLSLVHPIVIVGWQPGNRAVQALLSPTAAEVATDARSFLVLGAAR